MLEAALLFDLDGNTLYWHLPEDRTSVALPDSHSLWEQIWEHRNHLQGIAHTHPGSGYPHPSWEDITTFAACEMGLGKRLQWWIFTSDQGLCFEWVGPGKYDYASVEDSPCVQVRDRVELLRKSEIRSTEVKAREAANWQRKE